jgi:hypothetical protein
MACYRDSFTFYNVSRLPATSVIAAREKQLEKEMEILEKIMKYCFRLFETDGGVPSRDALGTAEEGGGRRETNG